MIERIMEIILYVISNVNDTKILSEDNILELENRGYTKSEISTAFSWLYEKSDANILDKFDDFRENTKGFRIFHNIEKDLFTNEAFTELVQYMTMGLISPYQVDIMIERLTISGFQIIDSRFLKNYLAALHIESMHVLNKPGRAMLVGNDTIN
jgi:uncharacterized protein Smg (DUF494 family)